jgi:hypothetical protein
MSFTYIDDRGILNTIDSALSNIRRQNGQPKWLYFSEKARNDFNAAIEKKSGFSGKRFIAYDGLWLMPSTRKDCDLAFFDERQPRLEGNLLCELG